MLSELELRVLRFLRDKKRPLSRNGIDYRLCPRDHPHAEYYCVSRDHVMSGLVRLGYVEWLPGSWGGFRITARGRGVLQREQAAEIMDAMQ